MKINLNYQFKNLSGKDFDKTDPKGEILEANHMGKLFAHCMWLSSEKNMKFKLWGEELYKTGCIEIDEVDFDLLMAWIEVYGTDPQKPYNTFFAQVGIKGQVIDAMKRQREKLNSKKQ